MSEFLKRKLRTFFTLFDHDKDGAMSRDDWMGLARLFVKFEKADKQKEEHLLTQFDKAWEKRLKHVENKNRVTMDEFVDSMLKQRHDPELLKVEEGLIRGFFNLMDVNCDGYLQEDEFKSIFVQFGVQDASFTKESFKAMDVNGDGKLSFEEYINGVNNFLYSDDENSSNRHLFGPLVH